ncbi:MAG TPA: hypothetical protein PKY87_01990 [Terricaulis sp.]|nr:hypothetical protein [Terricaulis sp.]
MGARNTLGLDDDLDSVELLIAIERVFDIQISDQDAAHITTMGDLYDLLTSKVEGGGEMCRSSMAFYRVRRALRAVLGDVDIRPDTPLRAIWNSAPKSLMAQAQQHCALRLPHLFNTNMGGIGAVLIAAAIFGIPILLIAQTNGWLILAFAAALTAVGITLGRLDPLSFGSLQTVGDLTARTATQNYGALARLGARTDNQSIWEALAEVASDASETLSAQEIAPDTIILQSQFNKARAHA